jgi:hypothetical protein
MKTTIISALLLFISITIFGQDRVYDTKELTIQGYSMQNLDSIYKNGLPESDTLHPLFTKDYFDTIVSIERIDLLQKMASYLKKNGFKWEPSIRIWTRIYFDTNGEVDYFLYHFMKPIDSAKEKEFRQLANNFFMEYKIQVNSSQKFSLCGQVVWKDN